MDPQWRRRLLVVEDEALTARLLRDVLEGLGFDVATASSALEARPLLDDFDPDVALVDLVLGSGRSGSEFAHVIHRHNPAVGIIILTRFPDLRSAGLPDDALPTGTGFVRKDMVEDPAYLVRAIDDVISGSEAGPRHDKDSDRPLGALTAAQHDVLRMVAQGYDNAAIAERRGCRLSTVETLLREIYRRLGVDTRGELNPRVEAARQFAQAVGLPERG